MPNSSATSRLDALLRVIKRSLPDRAATPLREILLSSTDLNLVSVRDQHLCYANIIELANMALEEVVALSTEEDREAGDDDTPLAVRAIMEVVHLFEVHTIQSRISVFGDVKFDVIEVLAQATRREGLVQDPSREVLQQLIAQVDAMAKRVLDSNLDGDFKVHCHDALNRLRNAFATYHVFGAEGVDRAIGELLVMAANEAPRTDEDGRTTLADLVHLGASATTIVHGWNEMSGGTLLPAATQVFLRLSGG